MEQRDIHFSFKARYCKLGNIDHTTRQVWFVIHGYGQLAHYFIRKFSVLEKQNICIIAPEGLSRFYLSELKEGGLRDSDRVGATWMTRENRLTDIENYITYLNAIYQTEIGTSSVSTTILGFSQGAATASRWAMSNGVPFDRLVLWAGAFPPDMDFEKGREILHQKEVVEVYGTRDPFILPERLAELQKLNDRLGIVPRVISFDGVHEIDEDTLLRLT